MLFFIWNLWLTSFFRYFYTFFMIEWWLLNFYYFYLNSNIFFNSSITVGSHYTLYKWIDNYDYGWHVMYSGPVLELLDFVDLYQVHFIFKQYNFINMEFFELTSQLVSEQVFIKGDIRNTKSFFLDTFQLNFNSLALSLYSLIFLSIYFSDFNFDLPCQNDQIVECSNLIPFYTPLYFYDFYFYDFLSLLEKICINYLFFLYIYIYYALFFLFFL